MSNEAVNLQFLANYKSHIDILINILLFFKITRINCETEYGIPMLSFIFISNKRKLFIKTSMNCQDNSFFDEIFL